MIALNKLETISYNQDRVNDTYFSILAQFDKSYYGIKPITIPYSAKTYQLTANGVSGRQYQYVINNSTYPAITADINGEITLLISLTEGDNNIFVRDVLTGEISQTLYYNCSKFFSLIAPFASYLYNSCIPKYQELKDNISVSTARDYALIENFAYAFNITYIPSDQTTAQFRAFMQAVLGAILYDGTIGSLNSLETYPKVDYIKILDSAYYGNKVWVMGRDYLLNDGSMPQGIWRYVVVGRNYVNNSPASNILEIDRRNLYDGIGVNVIKWAPITGASFYDIYRNDGTHSAMYLLQAGLPYNATTFWDKYTLPLTVQTPPTTGTFAPTIVEEAERIKFPLYASRKQYQIIIYGKYGQTFSSTDEGILTYFVRLFVPAHFNYVLTFVER